MTSGASPPRSNCRAINFWYSEFDRSDEVSPYSHLPVLYPQKEHATLTLKLFRREPAITKFDWLFTPYHRSSAGVARPVGSGLHNCFQLFHPAHGKLTSLRVLCVRLLFRAIHTRFRCGSGRETLASRTHKLVGSFFNRHAVTVRINSPLRLLVGMWFQVYFTALSGLLFTFPSRYLFTIGL